jgi:hypothetical protein
VIFLGRKGLLPYSFTIEIETSSLGDNAIRDFNVPVPFSSD